jgi:hypothetical protein
MLPNLIQILTDIAISVPTQPRSFASPLRRVPAAMRRPSAGHSPESVRRIARYGAWAVLIVLTAMTIVKRPDGFSLPFNLERLIAWASAGVVFATVYRERPLLLLALLIGAAGALEIAQFELAQFGILRRHGRFSDFLMKSAGVVVGIGAFQAFQYVRRCRTKSHA